MTALISAIAMVFIPAVIINTVICSSKSSDEAAEALSLATDKFVEV